MTSFFKKLSSGGYGLAKTYWLFGVLVGILLGIASSIASAIAPVYGSLALSLLAIPYCIAQLLGVWKAANQYPGSKIWAFLAKIGAVLGALQLISLLVILATLNL